MSGRATQRRLLLRSAPRWSCFVQPRAASSRPKTASGRTRTSRSLGGGRLPAARPGENRLRLLPPCSRPRSIPCHDRKAGSRVEKRGAVSSASRRSGSAAKGGRRPPSLSAQALKRSGCRRSIRVGSEGRINLRRQADSAIAVMGRSSAGSSVVQTGTRTSRECPAPKLAIAAARSLAPRRGRRLLIEKRVDAEVTLQFEMGPMVERVAERWGTVRAKASNFSAVWRRRCRSAPQSRSRASPAICSDRLRARSPRGLRTVGSRPRPWGADGSGSRGSARVRRT